MKRIELILLLLVMGTLWGFVEMLPLSVFILCSFGVLFLVVGRRLADVPGTSILIGLIVCLYKTYSAHFFICQWAGVMALAGSFDFFTSIVFRENWFKKFNPSVVGVVTNLSAAIVFLIIVNYIFIEPYWPEGGLQRALNYLFTSGLPAAALSGLISAPLGIYIADKMVNLKYSLNRRLVPGFYMFAIIFLWFIASIR
jgi:hypothetical protein